MLLIYYNPRTTLISKLMNLFLVCSIMNYNTLVKDVLLMYYNPRTILISKLINELISGFLKL